MIVRRHEGIGQVSEAWYSDCERYRYSLSRVWSEAPGWLFIGCNPSTATELANDPTIAGMQRRAMAAGAGSIWVGNCCAIRSTDPNGMALADDPVGPDNVDVLRVLIRQASHVVCGWGNHKLVKRHAQLVFALILAEGKEPLCFKQNRDGSPTHPLYQPNSARPRPMVIAP